MLKSLTICSSLALVCIEFKAVKPVREQAVGTLLVTKIFDCEQSKAFDAVGTRFAEKAKEILRSKHL